MRQGERKIEPDRLGVRQLRIRRAQSRLEPDASDRHDPQHLQAPLGELHEMTDPVAGEYVAYWRNASSDKILVVSSVGVNALLAARIKLNYVTGTAAGGTELTPVNLNKASSRAAPDDSVVMAMEGGAAATGVTGLTADGEIEFLFVGADGHEEFHLSDRVRLGQNDAIGVEVDEIASTGDVFGTMFGFYE